MLPLADLTARWRNDAACVGADPDLFVPEGQGQISPEAMRYCRDCPVRNECLDEALTMTWADDEGIWGGTTVRNRHHVRFGTKTRTEAMAAGDRIARRRTDAERLTDEPWLDGTEAAPVPIRRRTA